MDEKTVIATVDACAMAVVACEAMADNSIYEDDDDGQVRCNVCMVNIGEPGDSITDEIIKDAEHEHWCPVPMALTALEMWKNAKGKR